MWPTTTDGGPIAAASSTRLSLITLPPTYPRRGSSADPFSAASSTNTSGPRKTKVKTSGRVLEPHRVEDAIRTGKDCGIDKYPSTSLPMNKPWQAAALTAATLLAWLRLFALTAATLLPHPAGRRPADPRRLPAPPRFRPGSQWAADIVTAWDRITALPQVP
jgi:hypothetical protein